MTSPPSLARGEWAKSGRRPTRSSTAQVALKILPDAFAADPDRLARFTREAQILASLNHPNIAAIHGIEEAEGTRALVLELVEGPTLADRIAKGPIPLDEVLPIAKQIAEALEAAHEQGVIHRDLKPANIKVREDGTVKVLDFGLAKALDPNPEGDPRQSPTLTEAATQQGVIMGTAAYMSPEQAAGKPVDKRADIWSFGVVLFEMLTGKRAFDGETVSHVLAAVLKTEPDWAALPAKTPAAIQKLLGRCLAKERRRRVPDIGMARFEINDAMTAPAAEVSDAVAARQLQLWQRPTPLFLAGLALLLIGAFIAWRLTPVPLAAPAERFVVSTPGAPLLLTSNSNYPDVAISPDGAGVVYLSSGTGQGGQLRLRTLDRLTPTTLVAEGNPMNPFFSPDGEQLAFVAFSEMVLRRVSVNGGPTVEICALPDLLRGATWGANDTIIFTTFDRGLWSVPAGGGEPMQLTIPDERGGHWWPEMLPGGNAVLFTMMGSNAVGGTQIAALSLEEGGVPTLLNLGGSHPRFAPTGHLVYAVQGTLRAVGFDATRLEVTTDPITVVDGVNTKASGAANFALAAEGSLVFATGPAGGSVSSLVWVDRNGREEPWAR